MPAGAGSGGPRRTPGRAGPALVGALYLAAVLLPFRGFLPHFSTLLIGDHPDALLQHLHCAWQWLALAEGRFAEILDLPTLHPYRSGLAFGEPLVGISLPFAPIQQLSGSTAAAYNGAVVASFPLLGIATFLWVRELFRSASAGLLAAVLVVFNPWRIHFLTALNLLTIHYAVFGLWLVGRWLRRPSPASALAAAACFHVQLVTAAQGAIVAGVLALFWLGVAWLRSGLALRAARVRQGALAAALFVALALPWIAFFREAFDAAQGLPRTDQMQRYSLPFAEMARLFGALGPLGALAAAGVPALWLGILRRRLPAGVGVDVLGLALGALALFVVARGPYLGPPTDPTPLPGYYVAGALPWLDLFRAPIRLAAFTPLVLAVLAGGAMAVCERLARERWGRAGGVACALAPLALALLWPPLDPAMGAPIDARPGDRALAEALAALPAGAVVLSLPLDLEPSGAAVDERVLISRRAQIGGFASILPPVFPQLANWMGQWPRDADALAQVLGATHVVVPDAWLRRVGERAAREGYRTLTSVAGRSVLALPAHRDAAASLRLRVPAQAAAGRWVTLSVYPSEPRFHPRGHATLSALWRSAEREVRVSALELPPGIATSWDPILIHVPTPDAPGRYELRVATDLLPIDAELDVRDGRTTADSPIRAAGIALADASAIPEPLRAGGSFRVDVRIAAGPGPILLATSTRRLPDRGGETLVVYRFAPRRPSRAGGAPALAQAALSGDLAPGESIAQTWYLSAPPRPGRYDLLVKLVARGQPEMPMPWTTLIRDLRVVAD